MCPHNYFYLSFRNSNNQTHKNWNKTLKYNFPYITSKLYVQQTIAGQELFYDFYQILKKKKRKTAYFTIS